MPPTELTPGTTLFPAFQLSHSVSECESCWAIVHQSEYLKFKKRSSEYILARRLLQVLPCPHALVSHHPATQPIILEPAYPAIVRSVQLAEYAGALPHDNLGI